MARPGDEGLVIASVRFAGQSVLKAMPVGMTTVAPGFRGGWFNITFSIPQAVTAQLQERARRYPVAWTWNSTGCGAPHCVDDSRATWLMPTRLLLVPVLTRPSMAMYSELWVDGERAELQTSFNSRGLTRMPCLLGFYWDASGLAPEK